MNDNDQRSSRASVHYVGLIALLGLIGTFALLYSDKMPDHVAIFTGLAGAAIGAVCNLATNRSATNTTPPPQAPVEPPPPGTSQ